MHAKERERENKKRTNDGDGVRARRSRSLGGVVFARARRGRERGRKALVLDEVLRRSKHVDDGAFFIVWSEGLGELFCNFCGRKKTRGKESIKGENARHERGALERDTWNRGKIEGNVVYARVFKKHRREEIV